MVWVLRLIEDLPSVPEQYLKKLVGTEDLWEIRVSQGGDAYRLLGFFYGSKLLVVTSGFAKRSRKVPRSEVALAQQRRSDYLARKE